MRPSMPVLLVVCLWPSLVLADKMLSGEDAAYIDWRVKHCGAKSTDKEHAMVDQANAKDAEGKDLSDALSSPSKQAALCSDIKGWYGPYGSRFADLLKWESTPSVADTDKPAATASGRKGRKRSSQ